MPGAVEWAGPVPTMWEAPTEAHYLCAPAAEGAHAHQQRGAAPTAHASAAHTPPCERPPGVGGRSAADGAAAAAAAGEAVARPRDRRDPGADDHGEAGLAVYQLIGAETRFLHWEIFEQSCYSAGGWITLKDGDVVVDCGANIGLFTLWATQQADLAAVVAVEPMRPQYECLRRNIDLHALKRTVRPLRVAVGRRCEDDSAFVFYPRMPSSSHRATRTAEKESQREAMSAHRFEGATREVCRTTTLSSLFREERLPAVHLLKVDVEGDELAVLEGLGDTGWPLVHQVVMEAHDVDGRVGAIRELLASHGFDVRVLEGDPRMACNGCVNIAARRVGAARSPR